MGPFQRLLGFLACGNIFGDTRDPVNYTVGVRHRKGSVANPADRAVRTEDAILLVVAAAFLLSQRGFEYLSAIVGMKGVEPVAR